MNCIDVKKKIGNRTHFDLDVSFDFGNELVAVFGPSGSGKSLTLQLIAGLLRPDFGRIVVDDEVLYENTGSGRTLFMPPNKRRIGFVFQQPTLFPHLTVEQNIAYGHNGHREEIEELLDRFRLSGLECRYPSQLSLGQQQRVAIARALAVKPKLLLLDEPFSAMDSLVREKLRRDLRKSQRELKIPMIFVTHDLPEALTMADKMVILNNGSVLQLGAPRDIYNYPCSRTVARFVGMRNIFEGKVLVKDQNSNSLIIASEGFNVVIPYRPLEIGKAVTWGIRPENIMIVHERKLLKPSYQENIYEGTVAGIESKGMFFTLFVKVASANYDFEVFVFDHAFRALGIGIGQKIRIAFDKSKIRLLETSEDIASFEAPARDLSREALDVYAGGFAQSQG